MVQTITFPFFVVISIQNWLVLNALGFLSTQEQGKSDSYFLIQQSSTLSAPYLPSKHCTEKGLRSDHVIYWYENIICRTSPKKMLSSSCKDASSFLT